MTAPTDTRETSPMTAAELKTLRESLGLTLDAMAEMSGVQQRTAKYWESGRFPVPADVQEVLQRLDDRFEHMTRMTLEAMRQQRTQPAEVVLIRYRSTDDLHHYRPEFKPLPASAHGALLGRVAQAMRREGHTARIVFLEPDAYGAWLREQQRKDSEEARDQWALQALAGQAMPPRQPGRPANDRETSAD